MKRNYKFVISGCLIFLMVISCKDLLEVEPYGSVSDSALVNEFGINSILIGAYSMLDGSGAVGANYGTGIGFLRGADDKNAGTSWGVNLYDAYFYDASDNYINQKWRFLYAAVGRANDVLRILPKVEDSTPERLLQIEAEAKFLRGVYYLYLAMFWKNVPWIDENVSYDKGNYLVPNTGDIYLNIEDDFKFAADNLTEGKKDVGRANKWAAKSFLAKTYMFEHKYSEALVLLDDIILKGQTSNGLKYALLKKYNDNFVTRSKNSCETVFAAQMSVNDGSSGLNGNGTDHYNGTYGGPATCCYGFVGPSFDFVDAHQTDAVSGLPLLDTYMNLPIPSDVGLASSDPFTPYQGTLDPRLDWSIGRRGIPYRDWGVHPGEAWVRSHYVSGPYSAIKNAIEQARADTDITSGGGYTNSPYNMIRFADVLLWAAECEIEVGSLNKAEGLVNIVRARAANPDGFVHTYIDPDNPLKGFTDIPAANYKVGLYSGQFQTNGKTYAHKAVRFERRIEFGLEHHRFFDLVRWNGNDYDMPAAINWYMQHEGSRILDPTNSYLTGKFTANRDEYFPIPLFQIDLSVKDGKSVLIQNPGYAGSL